MYSLPIKCACETRLHIDASLTSMDGEYYGSDVTHKHALRKGIEEVCGQPGIQCGHARRVGHSTLRGVHVTHRADDLNTLRQVDRSRLAVGTVTLHTDVTAKSISTPQELYVDLVSNVLVIERIWNWVKQKGWPCLSQIILISYRISSYPVWYL